MDNVIGSVQARLHDGPGGTILWVVNPTREAKAVSVKLNRGPWQSAKSVWRDTRVQVDGQEIRLTILEEDGPILRVAK